MIFQAKSIIKADTLRGHVEEWQAGGEKIGEGFLIVIHMTPDEVGKLVVEKLVKDASNSIYSIFNNAARGAGGGWTKI